MTQRSRPRIAPALAGAILAAACGTAPAPAPSPAPPPEPGPRPAFVSRGRGLPARAQWRDGFDVADLDGDGVPDIVFGPPRKGVRRPGLFLGDGVGAFRFWSEASFPGADFDYGAAAAADWNGDGRTDVAFAVHLRGLVAFVHEGGGHFAPYADGLVLRPAAQPQEGPLFSTHALAVADWNGDGRPDLVALGEGPGRTEGAGSLGDARRGLRVFLNYTGAWDTVLPPAPEEEFGDGVAVGDVDGDGHPDAVVTSNVLGSKRILRRGRGRAWTAEAIDAVPPNAFVTAVVVAHLDRDRIRDVAFAWLAVEGGAWRSGIEVLHARPGTPGGFERESLFSEAGRRRITALAAGDVDGDLANDLATLDDEGTLRLFRGGGHDSFTPDAVLRAPAARSGCGGTHLRLRDMNGDGRDDLVASFAGEGNADRPCPTGGAIEVLASVPR